MESSAELPALDKNSTIVVIGAGLAGVRAGFGARQAGFEGRILLLSDEAHPPYDRPPLSKAVLMEDGHEAKIGLAPATELESARIELRLSCRCEAIDRDAREVRLSGSERIAYDRLVLATGSSIRTLPNLPYGAVGVHYLRTLDDALALKRAMAAAKSIAIIGAGVIGLEAAAVMASGGRSVLVVDPASRAMCRAACPPLADYLEARHRAQGVDFQFETQLSDAVSLEDGRRLLRLVNGVEFTADLILVGVGVTPNAELARAASLDVDACGIRVDGRGRTSDPAIYAAGEVAFHFNAAMDRHDKQETWAHAAAHGEHVGHALMGIVDTDYADTPSYWTDQYDIAVQVAGAGIGEQDVVRGTPASGSFVIFHLIGGAVAGVTAVNNVRELRAARKLIGARVDPLALVDTDVDLKTIAAPVGA